MMEYGYMPTDLNDELFLTEAPLDLIISAIEAQFDDPLEWRKKDYIQSFITKYEFSKDNMFEDDLVEVDDLRDKFVAKIRDIFEERLGIGFVNLDDEGDEEQHELIHLTYRFFIKNIKKNFVNLIINYIKDNEEEISNSYEKRKDVTSNTFKSEIDNEYDVLVISNLGTIIHDALDQIREYDEVDKFFKGCTSNEVVLELEYVKRAYDKIEITGNFIPNYIDMVDESFIMEIQSKIRNKILKKYPKRSNKSSDIEDLNKNKEILEIDPTEENTVEENENN